MTESAEISANAKRTIESLPRLTAAERKTLRANAERLSKTSGAKGEDARAILKQLDSMDSELASHNIVRQVKRGQRTSRNLPSQEPVSGTLYDQVKRAFSEKPPTRRQEHLLRVLAENPGLAATELVRAMGGEDKLEWQGHFGIMLSSRREYFNLLQAERYDSDPDKIYWTGLVSHYDSETSGFTMKSDAERALVDLGIIRQPYQE